MKTGIPSKVIRILFLLVLASGIMLASAQPTTVSAAPAIVSYNSDGNNNDGGSDCGEECSCKDGEKGDKGDRGPQGPAGPQGPIGLTGPTGPIGLTGPAGLNGTNGTDGKDGKDGPAGPQGPAGKDGITGPIGPQGLIGLTGPAGPTGLQGPIGLTGPSGKDGADGNDGKTSFVYIGGCVQPNVTFDVNDLDNFQFGKDFEISLNGALWKVKVLEGTTASNDLAVSKYFCGLQVNVHPESGQTLTVVITDSRGVVHVSEFGLK